MSSAPPPPFPRRDTRGTESHPTKPPILPYGSGKGSLKDLASRQRVLILCIGIYLAAVIVQFAVPPELKPILAGAAGVAIIAGAVYTFLLAIHIYGTGTGVVYGIISLIPLIGLIILVIVNQKATEILRKNGIHVGFFGAQGRID